MAILKPVSTALALSFIYSTLASAPHAHSNALPGHRGGFSKLRRQSVPTTLPGNWTSRGCFTDSVAARTLNGATTASSTNMTVENCIAFCEADNFIFAGVEFGEQCYCDNFIQNGGTNASLTDCNTACTGNAEESCGAANRLNVFWSGATPPPPPVTVAAVGNWTSLGCYSDNVNGNGRTLTVGLGLPDPTTIEGCTSACFDAGYQFAGAEFADQCFCDSAINNGGAPAAIGDCNMVCAGNSSEFCGGPNRLNMYNYTGANLPPISVVGGGGGGGGDASVFPVTSGLPGPWSYAACYVDNAHGRIFEFAQTPNPENTIQSCVATCLSQNFTMAGAEFGDECYCGDRLVNGAVVADNSTCNMGCAGNATEACGGPNRLSVYSSSQQITTLPVAVPQTTDLPGNWTYAGCYIDEPNNDGQRVLLWQNIYTLNNSATACASQCSDFGYTAAGMEFGDECYCGDIEDIAASGTTQAPASDCNIQCPGDPIHLCGGGLRLQMYTWNGTMNVWHTPSNIGRYEFFGKWQFHLTTVDLKDKVYFDLIERRF